MLSRGQDVASVRNALDARYGVAKATPPAQRPAVAPPVQTPHIMNEFESGPEFDLHADNMPHASTSMDDLNMPADNPGPEEDETDF